MGVGFGGVFCSRRVITLAVMFGGRAMRLRSLVVVVGGFGMGLLSHCFLTFAVGPNDRLSNSRRADMVARCSSLAGCPIDGAPRQKHPDN